jgi:hypothetical protein
MLLLRMDLCLYPRLLIVPLGLQTPEEPNEILSAKLSPIQCKSVYCFLDFVPLDCGLSWLIVITGNGAPQTLHFQGINCYCLVMVCINLHWQMYNPYQVTSAVWRLAGRLPSRLLQNTTHWYLSLATSTVCYLCVSPSSSSAECMMVFCSSALYQHLKMFHSCYVVFTCT